MDKGRTALEWLKLIAWRQSRLKFGVSDVPMEVLQTLRAIGVIGIGHVMTFEGHRLLSSKRHKPVKSNNGSHGKI